MTKSNSYLVTNCGLVKTSRSTQSLLPPLTVRMFNALSRQHNYGLPFCVVGLAQFFSPYFVKY